MNFLHRFFTEKPHYCFHCKYKIEEGWIDLITMVIVTIIYNYTFKNITI